MPTSLGSIFLECQVNFRANFKTSDGQRIGLTMFFASFATVAYAYPISMYLFASCGFIVESEEAIMYIDSYNLH